MEPKIKKVKSRHYYKISKTDLFNPKEIGQGGFGTVFHMKWKKDNEVQDVAAKRLFKVDDHELEVLSRLEHPNIVRLIGVVPEPVDFMLILELCELGSLRSFLTNYPDDLPFDLQRSWAEQAARAIEYLQDMYIIHKDIKSDNYVISAGNVLKLTDFGLAKLTDKTMKDVSERGTAAYMPPEVFIDGILSLKHDIFAYGVVVWEIVTKKIPFEGKDPNNIVYEVCQYRKRLPIPDCPQPFASIMRQCWLHDRNERPSIKTIIEMIERSSHHCLSKDSSQTKREWVLQRIIGKRKFGAAQDIAVSPTGEIAATDYSGGRLKLYCSTSGKLNHLVKFSDKHQSTTPYAVAVGSDGTYFVTDQTNCVTVIHSTSYTKHQFPVTLVDESNRKLMLEGLTLDNNGNLLIAGSTTGKGGYLLTYTQDGVQQRSARVNIQPKYLASTWQNTVVVSSMAPQTVQVVDRSGKRLHTLDAPDNVSNWWPRGICCTESRIMVANSAPTPDTGIYCYSLSGQYLDCITNEVAQPMGLAVVDNDNTLLMVAERDEGMKVFSSRHPDMGCDDRRIVHLTRHTGSTHHSQASVASLLDNLSFPPESPRNLVATDDEERGWKRSDSSTSEGSLLVRSEGSVSTSTSCSSYSSSQRTESTCSSTGEYFPSDGSLQQVQFENDIWTSDSLASEVASAYSDDLDWLDHM